MARFDVPDFLRRLRERGSALGEPFHYFTRSKSTNDEAKRAARRGATHGSLFLAEEQTAGRGRRGRQWFGTPGESLMFSVILRPELNNEALSPLTLAAGLATLDAVKQVGQATSNDSLENYKLKWPNDLVVGSPSEGSHRASYRKLAGLLLETELHDARIPSAVVVGLGINVGTVDFSEELQNVATSLAVEGLTCSREELLVSILAQLSTWVSRYERHGRSVLAEGLAKADALFQQPVSVEVTGQPPVVGVGAGIREDGALLVNTGRKVVPVVSGTIATHWFSRGQESPSK